ncbi:MAG: hypothetical protein JXA00_00785 [Candidatus Thermoplasmatota archaeon]|nr:hypothetical protein [Candidatus Thermoplasmatota archaeon]
MLFCRPDMTHDHAAFVFYGLLRILVSRVPSTGTMSSTSAARYALSWYVNTRCR